MRRVDRSSEPAPSSLVTPSLAVKTEIATATTYYASVSPQKAYPFKQYKNFDVTSTLRKLFHNKCAYCESDLVDSLDVEHFRPKGAVTGEPAHPGYWWLALKWENLLPACVGCNQERLQHLVTPETTEEEFAEFQSRQANGTHGKGNHFPISGTRALNISDSLSAERHHLLDPTVDDPDQFLLWSIDSSYSIVLPSSSAGLTAQRGLSTIEVFALNRFRLVQSRTKLLNELRSHAALIIQELEEDFSEGGRSDRAMKRALERVKALRSYCSDDHVYSSMARSFLKNFADELTDRIKRQGGMAAAVGAEQA